MLSICVNIGYRHQLGLGVLLACVLNFFSIIVLYPYLLRDITDLYLTICFINLELNIRNFFIDLVNRSFFIFLFVAVCILRQILCFIPIIVGFEKSQKL